MLLVGAAVGLAGVLMILIPNQLTSHQPDMVRITSAGLSPSVAASAPAMVRRVKSTSRVPPAALLDASPGDLGADPPGTQRDPFEEVESSEPTVRALVSVGDLDLGIVTNSTVHSQDELVRHLIRLGRELSGRNAAEAQELLDSHRQDLAEYMDGEVEIRGPEWTIGAEIGPALPMESWWRPKPY